MKTRTFLVALLFVTGCTGGTSSVPAPSSASASLAAQTQALDALVSQQVTQNITPGIAVGIARNGQVIYTRAFGNRSLGPNQPVQLNTPFEIGSMTKEFTAAAILLLVQDGKIGLDDPLSKYIPEYVNAGKMTLRQLVTMTSGVPSNDNPIYAQIIPQLTLTSSQAAISATIIAALNNFPSLDFAPGTKMAYANYGFWLLGEVIRRVTGSSYIAFLTQRIFAPLGMTSTYLYNTPPNANEAVGYAHQNFPDPFTPSPDPPAFIIDAQGGLTSTVADILTWDIALTSGRVLSAPFYQTMLTVPGGGSTPTIVGPPGGEILLRENDGSASMYAMGWFVPGTNYFFHPGGTGGFTTMNANFNDGTSIVIFTNQHLGAQPIGDFIPNLAPALYRILNPSVMTPNAFTILQLPTVMASPVPPEE